MNTSTHLIYNEHFLEAPNFTLDELRCPTSGIAQFEQDFLSQLHEVRTELAKPMTPTSCCRSDEHLDLLLSRGYAASKNSFHLIENEKYNVSTCAIDVHVPDSNYRANMISIGLTRGWSFGIAKSFLHMDLRAVYTKLPQIIYVY